LDEGGDQQVATARQGARIALLGASLTAPACRFVFADADLPDVWSVGGTPSWRG
jgi:hypothetical protein